MKARLAPILLAALAIAGGAAARAHAEDPAPMSAAPVLALSVDFTDPAFVPPGMTVVFVPAAGDGFADGGDGFADGGDGFADGGDGPGGLVWVVPASLPDGFADGGDLPDGFVALMAQPVGDEFWREGVVPDGMLPVLAWQAPDGFADGGDLPVGWVPVLFPTIEVQGLGP
jgi:hypothetical protein